jgi:hypothetical protein
MSYIRESGSTGRTPMSRGRFLKLSAAGIAGASIVSLMGAGTAVAQPDLSLMAEFEAAAEEYGLPVEVLLAIGYVNTRWEMPPPEASEYERGSLHGWGGYGIMALVRNPSTDTLGEASRLTGIPVETLKTDRAANIRGGAALLASSAGRGRPDTLRGYSSVVAGRGNGKSYRATAGVGGGDLYAGQVLDTLERGASSRTKNGERVSLAAQDLNKRGGKS